MTDEELLQVLRETRAQMGNILRLDAINEALTYAVIAIDVKLALIKTALSTNTAGSERVPEDRWISGQFERALNAHGFQVVPITADTTADGA